MALIKPKLYQIDTGITAFSDPITVLHQGASSANVDVGFLFNRANGLVSNVALYWSESTQSIVTAYTANSGVTNSNVSVTSYANLTVGNVLLVNGSILNVTGNINANTLGTHYGNVITTYGIFWANGTSFSSGSSYGNTQVAAYLPTYSGTIGGDITVGGNLTVTGNTIFKNTEIVTGVEIVAGNLVANSGTTSTSISTGALVVAGGAGVSGNLNVGDTVTATQITISATNVALGNNNTGANQIAGAIAIGSAGGSSQGANAIAIGSNAGQSQLFNAIAIGSSAGQTNQGSGSIAIGYAAGQLNQANNSIVLNASGTALNLAIAGLYIAPVRNDTGNVAQAVYYNTSTKELTYASASAFTGGYIPNQSTFGANLVANS